MKGQSPEEKARILAIAGNPKNGLVEPLLSIPNGYRILTRVYTYDPKKKRSANQKMSLGVVIDDKFMTSQEYRSKYTKRGFVRVKYPETKNETPKDDSNPATQEQELGAIYQRMLGAIPILYGSAVNCGIVEDLNKVYDGTVVQEILSLAIHWIQDRDNVARRFPRFSEVFALPFPGHIDEEQLARLYSHLGKDKVSISKLFALRCERLHPQACVNYDSTSIPTKASDIYYRKFSKSKEGVIEPMMHLSLLVEQETGMPLMYRLFSGNTPDCVTIVDLIKRIEELSGKNDLLFVFDRGYETRDNLQQCSQHQKKCLMAAASLERKYIRDVRDKYADFWDASSVIPGTRVHGHTDKVKIKHRGQEFEVWVHVFRSDEKNTLESGAFYDMLNKYESRWKTASRLERRKLLEDDRSRFYKDCPELKGDLVRADDVLNDYTKDFGFFANVSLKEMTAAQAYDIYRRRDNIEKCFKSGKMGFKLDTARSHRQDTMEGRFVVAFVALSILAELKSQLAKERPFEDKRKKPIPGKAYSVTDIIEITAGTTINYGQKTKKHWVGGTLKELKRVCVASGFDENLYDHVPAYIESWSQLR